MVDKCGRKSDALVCDIRSSTNKKTPHDTVLDRKKMRTSATLAIELEQRLLSQSQKTDVLRRQVTGNYTRAPDQRAYAQWDSEHPLGLKDLEWRADSRARSVRGMNPNIKHTIPSLPVHGRVAVSRGLQGSGVTADMIRAPVGLTPPQPTGTAYGAYVQPEMRADVAANVEARMAWLQGQPTAPPGDARVAQANLQQAPDRVSKEIARIALSVNTGTANGDTIASCAALPFVFRSSAASVTATQWESIGRELDTLLSAVNARATEKGGKGGSGVYSKMGMLLEAAAGVLGELRISRASNQVTVTALESGPAGAAFARRGEEPGHIPVPQEAALARAVDGEALQNGGLGTVTPAQLAADAGEAQTAIKGVDQTPAATPAPSLNPGGGEPEAGIVATDATTADGDAATAKLDPKSFEAFSKRFNSMTRIAHDFTKEVYKVDQQNYPNSEAYRDVLAALAKLMAIFRNNEISVMGDKEFHEIQPYLSISPKLNGVWILEAPGPEGAAAIRKDIRQIVKDNVNPTDDFLKLLGLPSIPDGDYSELVRNAEAFAVELENVKEKRMIRGVIRKRNKREAEEEAAAEAAAEAKEEAEEEERLEGYVDPFHGHQGNQGIPGNPNFPNLGLSSIASGVVSGITGLAKKIGNALANNDASDEDSDEEHEHGDGKPRKRRVTGGGGGVGNPEEQWYRLNPSAAAVRAGFKQYDKRMAPATSRGPGGPPAAKRAKKLMTDWKDTPSGRRALDARMQDVRVFGYQSYAPFKG